MLFLTRKNPSYLIYRSVIAIFSIVCYGGVSYSGQEIQSTNWDRINKAYDAYIDYPNLENACRLLNTLPRDRTDDKIGNAARGLDHIFSVDNFPVLHGEASSGDRVSIEIMFRLLNVSDGYSLELLSALLGQIARDKPQLFLEILENNKDSRHIKTWGPPVAFGGAGYNVHPRAERYFLEKQLESLETVENPELAEVKAACINKIREVLERIQE